MAKNNINLRFVIFCIFFAAGVGAIALSILAGEIRNELYGNKAALSKINSENEEIESMISQYDSQIKQIQTDPEVLDRFKRVTLGQPEPQSDDTAYPTTSEEQLKAATQALLEDLESKQTEPEIPNWVKRCSQPRFRQSLFFAGTALLLITFLFFGLQKSKSI